MTTSKRSIPVGSSRPRSRTKMVTRAQHHLPDHEKITDEMVREGLRAALNPPADDKEQP